MRNFIFFLEIPLEIYYNRFKYQRMIKSSFLSDFERERKAVDPDMNPSEKKKILPFLSAGAILILCAAFHFSLLLGGETKLLPLFQAPAPLAAFGGTVTYLIFYCVFFATALLFSYFKPKLTVIPAGCLILFESIMLLLPAYYYAEQFGSKQAGYYLQSLFSDRLLLTLKTISVLIFGLIFLFSALSRKTGQTICIISGIVFAVAVIAAEMIYILNPEVNQEILSFWIKFPFSVIFDLFRLIAFSLLPALCLLSPHQKKKEKPE